MKAKFLIVLIVVVVLSITVIPCGLSNLYAAPVTPGTALNLYLGNGVPSDSYVKFGDYGGNDILWRVLRQDDGITESPGRYGQRHRVVVGAQQTTPCTDGRPYLAGSPGCDVDGRRRIAALQVRSGHPVGHIMVNRDQHRVVFNRAHEHFPKLAGGIHIDRILDIDQGDFGLIISASIFLLLHAGRDNDQQIQVQNDRKNEQAPEYGPQDRPAK